MWQVIEKPDLVSFVQNLMHDFRVEGVTRKGQSVYGESFFYGPIGRPEELCLDFDRTVMPPKKYFLPPREELFRFRTGDSPEAVQTLEAEPFVLFGVHPYDLKAIGQMDRIFSNGTPDPYYLKRREAAVLIGVEPRRIAPRAFWASMEAAYLSSGFDLMLTDVGEGFVVEVGTDKGSSLVERYARARPAERADVSARTEERLRMANLPGQGDLNFPKREIPLLLQRFEEHLLWEENATKCLSCGTCNLVCPTCYCFDVSDEMEWGLVQGKRVRRWDGCLLRDFARVASGENFRETRMSRYRHRFYRKGQYLFNKLGDVACVGCGRCAAFCLPDIADPLDIFNRLKEDEK